jgi:colanic acid biosynthesis glycosyl transferase WcaI
MRILIHGINYSPELVGIGKYTGEMAAFLAQQGHQVRVVTALPYYPDWRVHPGYSPWKYHQESLEGVRVYRCPIYVSNKPSGLARIFHLASFAIISAPLVVAQAAWKPNLVMSIAPAIAGAPFSWLTARLAGCPAWLHIQDFELDAAINLDMLPGRKRSWAFHYITRVLQFLENWLLNRFDRLSSISQRMLDHLLQKGIPANRISLLPNWVDCQVIFPLAYSSPYRSEWGLKSDQISVLYAGSMGQKQGLELLLQAARTMQNATNDNPDRRFLFILCGEGTFRRELETQAIGLKNVFFTPLQPADKLNELLNAADIHVLLQRPGIADKVMPSKLTGMLASGKPVVATADPGTELAQVIEQVGLLVPPDNLISLCNALETLGDQPVLRNELGCKGRRFAQAHWDKQAVLQNFVMQLESLRV